MDEKNVKQDVLISRIIIIVMIIIILLIIIIVFNIIKENYQNYATVETQYNEVLRDRTIDFVITDRGLVNTPNPDITKLRKKYKRISLYRGQLLVFKTS